MNSTGCPKIGEAFIEACVNDADASKVSDDVCNIMCENYTYTYIPVAKAGYIDSSGRVALKDLESRKYFIGELTGLHEFTNEQYLREKANVTLKTIGTRLNAMEIDREVDRRIAEREKYEAENEPPDDPNQLTIIDAIPDDVIRKRADLEETRTKLFDKLF